MAEMPKSITVKVKVELEWPRCEFSDLFVNQCAHCLGHKPDWWEPKRKVVLGE